MPTSGTELITMADIARLAGQSRATVGNWKARNPDFPAERERGPRGPLYDRAEVMGWLQSTGRVEVPATDMPAVWHLTDQLRGSTSLRSDEILEILFALLAVRARSTPEDWRDLRASPPDMLNSVLHRKLMADVSLDTLLSRTFPAVAVAQAIETISSVDAPVGEIADSLIERFAGVASRTGDNYVVPPSIRRLMISMSQPTGVIYDPAAGFGQLLIDAAEAGSGPYDLLGQERSAWACTMAQLNLVIHGIHGEIAAGDVFRHDMFPQLRANRVMAVPPFGPRKLPSAVELAGDPRWVWGEPGANDADAAWIQHCLFHLADNGRAVLVLPNRILFTGGRTGRVRQRIVEAGLLDAVVALPPGLFHSTSVASSLLVFVKGRAYVNGTPAPTLMIDTRNSTLNRARPTKSLPADLIGEVTELYHEWAAGISLDSDLSAVAYFDDLAANDFVIDPARYASVPRTAWNADEAATDRTALIGQLEALTQASRAADDHLTAILKGRK
jgi:type I restriction-modification system DNA methylase subunit/predicted DNA-binding transcriptional regulator AlpA